ncbi:MAG: pilus assembly protein PilM, partial [Cryobacterium sp.]|nr:pilus assembly protein PilM [Oligoflexia bacterium]
MAGTFGFDACVAAVQSLLSAPLGAHSVSNLLSHATSHAAGVPAWSMAAGGVVSGLSDILSSFGNTKANVGVCVGANSTKVVEIKRSKNGWMLSRFGISILPEDTVVNREVFNPVAVANSVRQAISQAKITQKS